ncbi:formyltetrahydrofolate deformylase [Bacillus carboniphilus]|uniref:Formyltetrahydrofolate deformylase n=1 Tax=Bacillus carboniphilus TaxID=86663 RepID=A0ABY9JSS2_9BACI|nr:formyltetrahydrofolate deformylase [Bacillus carboniphilus]WLR42442.1 formyltetrahydrofolate deformylase [Bacillus carboniphilus]
MNVHKQIEKFKKQHENRGRLLIHCPDKPGIVASVSTFLKDFGANIIESNQFSTDPSGGSFFLRIEFDCPYLVNKMEKMLSSFSDIANQFSMSWTLTRVSDVKKCAVFVSKELHCLQELLWEWQSGELMIDIPLVISNHLDAKEVVKSFGIPFYHIQSSRDIRKQVEQEQLKLLNQYSVDFIVLARYMQILTPEFVEQHPNQIINIHHSFLPAFVGAKPYERAFKRGVKLIGATSHYVTNDLDEGPIIEQDIERVDHRQDVEGLKVIGRKIERNVLAQAVKWHIEDRIIVFKNKTIVF